MVKYVLLLCMLITYKANCQTKEALKYAKGHNLNQEVYITIDYGIHSGKKRLSVWDMQADTVMYTALVSHGCGEYSWADTETSETPSFSNVSGSHLSSLGKFRIGKRAYSNWGINIHYKLHGLEKSNSNAYKRIIVLHGWESVSDTEVYPEGTYEGWGCPAVSNNTMRYLDKLLKQHNNVLLWGYLKLDK